MRNIPRLKYIWSNFHNHYVNHSHNFPQLLNWRNINFTNARNVISQNGAEKNMDSSQASFQASDRISKGKVKYMIDCFSKDKCSREQSLLLFKCSAELSSEISPSKKAKLILSAWKTLKKSGPATLEHYHALLSSLCAISFPVIFDEILSELKDDGLKPDDVTYLKLLQCVCEAGDIDQAKKILSLLKESGFAANQATFNAVIVCYGKSRNVENVEETLKLMHQAGIDAGPETFTSMLRSFAEIGDEQKFKNYFDKYHSKISDSQRLIIIKSLCKRKMYNLIPEVMRDGNWNADEIQENLISTIIELTYTDNLDAALIIAKTISSTNKNSKAKLVSILIREMVKTKVPLQRIIEVCDELETQDHSALLKACETALRFRPQDDAVELLKCLADADYRLKPHFFWPLIIKAGATSGEIGVFKVLKIMLELNVKPDHDTLTNWFFTQCNLTQPLELVRKLQDHGLTISHVQTPLSTALLFSGKLKLAATVCRHFKGELEWKKLLNPLVKAYFKTRDIRSFELIIKQINDADFGNEILKYSMSLRNYDIDEEAFTNMMAALEKRGYHISDDVFANITPFIHKEENTNNGIRSNKYFVGIPNPRNMGVEELENHLIELKSKGMNTRGVLRLLLQQYCKNKEVEKALLIKKEFVEKGYELSPGMKSSLLEIYLLSEQLEEAENCLKELLEKYPDFKVDSFKILKLANHMVTDGKYESALQLLRGLQPGIPDPGALKNCTNLLKTVADQKGPTETKEMFDLLLEKRLCTVSNLSLGPLVSAHMKRDDFQKAVTLFEEFAAIHKFTPLQASLMMSLIERVEKLESESHSENNEAALVNPDIHIHLNLLDRVCSAAESVHGLENTNVLLFISLAKVGSAKRIKQIMSDPKRKLNVAHLVKNCKRLADKNELEPLRRIAFSVKAFTDLDIKEIYDSLLNVYIRRGDCEGALNLWTELQEKDIAVSEKFLGKLQTFLVINKRQVPFLKISSSNSNSMNVQKDR